MLVSPVSLQNNNASFKALKFHSDAKRRVINGNPVIKEQIEGLTKQLENTSHIDLHVAPLNGSRNGVRFYWTEKDSDKLFFNCAFNVLPSSGDYLMLKPLSGGAGCKYAKLVYSEDEIENAYAKLKGDAKSQTYTNFENLQRRVDKTLTIESAEKLIIRR